MQRNVYIEGEMGHLFGETMTINAPTINDVFKLIDANSTGFKKYMIDCHEKGVGFAINVAGEEVEYEEELLLPLHEGDITITPVPEGAGGGFKKILAAIAIVAVIYFFPVLGSQAGSFASATAAAGATGFAAMSGLTLAGLAVATSLALSGLMEVMAPDPSVDMDQEQSYLFNGAEQNVIEGDPVPVLYGHLRIPGQPINFEVSNIDSMVDYAVDTTKFLQKFSDKDGNVDWGLWSRTIAYLENPDGFVKELVNYGKSLGRKSIEAEIKNEKPLVNTKDVKVEDGGQTPYDDKEAFLKYIVENKR